VRSLSRSCDSKSRESYGLQITVLVASLLLRGCTMPTYSNWPEPSARSTVLQGFLTLSAGCTAACVSRLTLERRLAWVNTACTLYTSRQETRSHTTWEQETCAALNESCVTLCTTACCPLQLFTSPPRLKRDYPLNLSISVSGGKETKRDFLSRGDRNGKSSAHNLPGHPAWGGMLRLDVQSYPSTTRY